MSTINLIKKSINFLPFFFFFPQFYYWYVCFVSIINVIHKFLNKYAIKCPLLISSNTPLNFYPLFFVFLFFNLIGDWFAMYHLYVIHKFLNKHAIKCSLLISSNTLLTFYPFFFPTLYFFIIWDINHILA